MSRYSSKLETTDRSAHNWLSVGVEIKIQFNYILKANIGTGNFTKIYNSEEKVATPKYTKKNGSTYRPYYRGSFHFSFVGSHKETLCTQAAM